MSTTGSVRFEEDRGTPLPKSLGALAIAAAVLASAVAVTHPSALELGASNGPLLLLAAAGVTGLAVAIVGWPSLALVALVLFVELHLSEVLVRYHGLPSLLQLLAIPLALSALVARPAGQRARALAAPIVLLLAGDTVIRLTSTFWASSAPDALDSAIRSAKALVLAATVALLISSASRLRLAMWAMVSSGTALGSLAIVQAASGRYDWVFGGLARVKRAQIWGDVFEPRVAGPLGDPNFFAQVILVLIPIGLALAWSSSRPAAKATALAMTAVLVVTVGLTYSRGAVVATVVAVALSLVGHGLKARQALLIAAVGTICLLLLPEDLGRRLTSLREVATGQEAETLHPDSSFAKRRLLTRTAWEMFLDRPLSGVGAGNYSERFRDYGDRVGSPAPDYDDPAERSFAHSLGLELAAELGLTGLAWFGTLILVSFWTIVQVSRELADRGQSETVILVRSLAPALAGFLVAGLFLHLRFERYLWLLFALIAGVSTWTRRSSPVQTSTRIREPEVAG